MPSLDKLNVNINTQSDDINKRLEFFMYVFSNTNYNKMGTETTTSLNRKLQLNTLEAIAKDAACYGQCPSIVSMKRVEDSETDGQVRKHRFPTC